MATAVHTSPGPLTENATRLEQVESSNQVESLLSRYLSDWSYLQIAVTVLLVLVAYDQCTLLGKYQRLYRRH
jgi:hypothetical protein